METPIANTEGSKFHPGRLESWSGSCGSGSPTVHACMKGIASLCFSPKPGKGATPPFMIGLKISLGLKRNTAAHCLFEKITHTQIELLKTCILTK